LQNGTICIARAGQDELLMEYLQFPNGRKLLELEKLEGVLVSIKVEMR